MADEKTTEEIQAEKEAELKAATEAEAKAKAEAEARNIKVVDGKVELSEQDYNNLVNMKEDMITYKDAKRKAETELENIKVADLKAKEEQKIKDKEFEDLYNTEKEKGEALILKTNNQAINHALAVKALEAGIKKAEYVKLIDKSKVSRDEAGEISGVDEVVESFKKDNPDLFGSGPAAPPVDNTHGAAGSGVISDADLVKLTSLELVKIKKEDPKLYERWSDLATKGRPIPERDKDDKKNKT